MADYLTQADVAAVIGAGTVVQLFDDDHDGVADVAKLDALMAQAEGLAASYLLRGFTQEQILILAANDPFFVSQVAWVCAELATETRTEFLAQDGKGRYWSQYERAVAYFERLSKSQIHSKGEAQAGANANSGGALKPIDTATGKPPKFVFASDDDRPNGRGGY